MRTEPQFAAKFPRGNNTSMLAILGGFLLATAVVHPVVDSRPCVERCSVGAFGFELLTDRLEQLELKLENTAFGLRTNQNTLLEKLTNSFNIIENRSIAIQQQTSQILDRQMKNHKRIIESCDEATTSGKYYLQLPINGSASITVVCDMEVLDGGWLVIQRRFDGSLNFNRSWAEYRNGFGVVEQSSEFWLGLETIHQLTKAGGHEILIQLKNATGHYGYVRNRQFVVAGEDQCYKLSYLGEYSGTIGNYMQYNENRNFSTYDRNNDPSGDTCAQKYASGWWFDSCSATILNGPFKYGIYWHRWTYAATYSRILIRRSQIMKNSIKHQNLDQERKISSCDDATTTGRYRLHLRYGRLDPIPVVCDMQVLDGGWLVIQSRSDGSVNFNRSWTQYRDGFGVVGQSTEFWLGLEAIHQLTFGNNQELLVELKNITGHFEYARYQRFEVLDEERGYTLVFLRDSNATIKNFLEYIEGQNFSTYDKDNNKFKDNCVQRTGGGWWFYKSCFSNLNAQRTLGTGWTNIPTYSRMLIRPRYR